jgi:hypothetical protein
MTRSLTSFAAVLWVGVALCVAKPLCAQISVQVDPGTAISAAALAVELLTGINRLVTDDTRVDAQTISAGPDEDDIGFRATSDVANTPLETDLEAWTTRDTGGLTLGPNPPNPHTGHARLHVQRGFFNKVWTVVPGHRYALAFPRPDSTPVPNADNTTAVASVATFAHNGAIQKAFTVADTSDALLQNGKRVALQIGEEDITVKTGAALVWSREAFKLEDDGTSVMVVPPVQRVTLFHNFVQLQGHPNFRNPFITGNHPLLDRMVENINNAVNTTLNQQELSPLSTVDFTLAAAAIVFEPGTFVRGTKTDRQIIEEYLLSNSVHIDVPSSVQPGYMVRVTLRELLGGTQGFMAGSFLEQQGGFGTPDPTLGEQEQFLLQDMFGLVVESQGSLLEAINLAAQTPGSDIANLLAGLNVGDSFSLNLLFNQSDQVHAFQEVNVNVPEPSTLAVFLIGSSSILGLSLIRYRKVT